MVHTSSAKINHIDTYELDILAIMLISLICYITTRGPFETCFVYHGLLHIVKPKQTVIPALGSARINYWYNGLTPHRQCSLAHRMKYISVRLDYVSLLLYHLF